MYSFEDNRLVVPYDEYTKRYGEADSPTEIAEALADAADALLSAYEQRWGHYVTGAHRAFDRGHEAVACAMVRRAATVPEGFAGATQYSQGAGGYTASVTYGGSLGDIYISKSDKKRLGLLGTTIGGIAPEVMGGCHGC